MNATAAEPLAHYRAAFESVSAGQAGTAAQRAAAFERFAALGFPGAREETWKYTSLRRLESRRFPVKADSAAAMVLPAALAGCRIAVIDGRHRPDLSEGGLPAGMHLRTLAQAQSDGESTGALLRVAQGGGTERFAALNAALCPDVLLLDVTEGASAEPIEIVVASTAAEPGMSHPRLIVRAARGSTSRRKRERRFACQASSSARSRKSSAQRVRAKWKAVTMASGSIV